MDPWLSTLLGWREPNLSPSSGVGEVSVCGRRVVCSAEGRREVIGVRGGGAFCSQSCGAAAWAVLGGSGSLSTRGVWPLGKDAVQEVYQLGGCGGGEGGCVHITTQIFWVPKRIIKVTEEMFVHACM